MFSRLWTNHKAETDKCKIQLGILTLVWPTTAGYWMFIFYLGLSFPLLLFCHPRQCLLLILLFGFFHKWTWSPNPGWSEEKSLTKLNSNDEGWRGHCPAWTPVQHAMALFTDNSSEKYCTFHCSENSNIALHVWIFHQLQQPQPQQTSSRYWN